MEATAIEMKGGNGIELKYFGNLSIFTSEEFLAEDSSLITLFCWLLLRSWEIQ